MDPNMNFYPNMNTSLNNSMDLNALNMQNIQDLTPEQILLLQQINEQRIQAIQSQLAQTSLAAGSDPYASSFQAISPSSPTPIHVTMGQMYNPQMPPLVRQNGPTSPVVPGFQMGMVPQLSSPVGTVPLNSPIMIDINGQLPNAKSNPRTDYNQMAYPNATNRITTQMAGQNHAQVPTMNGRQAEVPDSLPLRYTNQPRGTSYSSSNYSSSPASTPHDSPAMPKKPHQGQDIPDGTRFAGDRPRQRMSSPPPAKPPSSSRSSTSSASIPGSPASSGPLSPDSSTWSDASGQLSPSTPRTANGDARSQIKNKPLQMETRYPQDKCYTCMKKVYPMEKLGPVKGVVYHKSCFRCKTCNTTLNLKNFTHSQVDQFDLSVYCKSHQPSTEKGPKLDAQSIEIKAALKAPKQGGVLGGAERVPENKYSYDVTCREMVHARKAPVAQLQSGVKVGSNAWSKSKRDKYMDSPREVVKHDTPVPEYDQEEYHRHKVETEPDYT